MLVYYFSSQNKITHHPTPFLVLSLTLCLQYYMISFITLFSSFFYNYYSTGYMIISSSYNNLHSNLSDCNQLLPSFDCFNIPFFKLYNFLKCVYKNTFWPVAVPSCIFSLNWRSLLIYHRFTFCLNIWIL